MDTCHATELTTLTGGVHKHSCNSCFVVGNDGDKAITWIKKCWSQTSYYFWKLLIFLMILVIINTILRSLLVKDTNLIFTTDKNDENNSKSTNYVISSDKIKANALWIATDLELDVDNHYVNKRIVQQGVLFETDIDIDIARTSDYRTYEFNELQSAIHDMDTPFRIYTIIDDNLIDSVAQVIDNLTCHHDIWQNSLVIIKAKYRTMVCGPRIPNKKRGKRISELSEFGELLT